ncbi:MAG: nucleoside-diphosphate-sugar epimerase [Bradymonadia bacterium]|jgi:nucleoside-diphosphate-sugar epimerase
MIQGETILLTGGAGFIGTRLCEELCERNTLRVLDTFSRNSWETTRLRGFDNVELIRGDVRKLEDMKRAAEGVTRIVHLASIAGVGTVLNNPALTMDVALTGTKNALEVGRENGCQRVVTFSTSEVFGRFAWDVKESDVTPIGAVGEPRWTYACAKIATEHLANAYFREFDLPTVSLRPFNVYGPGQVGEGAIHNFIRKVVSGEAITVNNDGRQIRSWCYVDDMVEGTLRALESDSAPGESFNIGNPAATITVLRLAELVARIAGVEPKIEFVRKDYPDVETRVPNADKARNLLGFEAKVGLEEGLARTVAWYRENA